MTFRISTTPLATAVRMPEPRSGGMASELLGAFVPAPGIAPLLERLNAPGALAVTTGQQPALFTGPAYTIHKALSAAALAARLEAVWARPVVPIFWIAGDDHDFAEANHVAWLGGDGSVHEARLRERAADDAMLPLYREPVGAEVAEAIAALRATLPASDYRDEMIDWIERHFQADVSIAAAFGGAIAELLAPLGVVCLDSTHRAFKRAVAPLLLRTLREAIGLEAGLVRRAAALSADGRDAGVAVGDGATLVMLEARQGRDRLVRDGDAFVTRRSGERFSLPQIEAIAAAEPERLSANVLLRPVIESALLPTVAYAAGPGELRYLALAEALYAPLDVVRQTPVPRWSGMVVDARIDRIMKKFNIEPEGLTADAAALETRIVRARMPAEADLELGGLRASFADQFAALRTTASRVDPTVIRTVATQRDRALAGVERIERKLVAALRRRMQVELGQLAVARAAIAPGGKPQERVLSAVSFLARHGPPLLDAELAAANAWYAGALEGARVSA